MVRILVNFEDKAFYKEGIMIRRVANISTIPFFSFSDVILKRGALSFPLLSFMELESASLAFLMTISLPKHVERIRRLELG